MGQHGRESLHGLRSLERRALASVCEPVQLIQHGATVESAAVALQGVPESR